MKNFPYRILFVCLVFPPICYIFSLSGLETYLHRSETEKLDRILIQNYSELYAGRHTIKEEINRNISTYHKNNSLLYRMGVSINILIKTKNNRILYPTQLDSASDVYGGKSPDLTSDYMEVAAENYRIINDGLPLDIQIRIKQNSLLSNGILLFFILIALSTIMFFIKRSIRQAEENDQHYLSEISRLQETLKKSEYELSAIKTNETDYQEKIKTLQREKNDLSTDIDSLLDEMESLEEGLNKQKGLREKSEKEILELNTEIENFKKKITKPKKNKTHTSLEKRFKVLYKNLTFTDKAIDGFLSLSEEFQLKAEEIIHRINENDSVINIRRKVFSKGGKINVLEADFSYSGRIYFQKDSNSKINIIVIGTKKTQTQDLAFLNREYN